LKGAEGPQNPSMRKGARASNIGEKSIRAFQRGGPHAEKVKQGDPTAPATSPWARHPKRPAGRALPPAGQPIGVEGRMAEGVKGPAGMREEVGAGVANEDLFWPGVKADHKHVEGAEGEKQGGDVGSALFPGGFGVRWA